MDKHDGRIFMWVMVAAFGLGLASTLKAPYGFWLLPVVGLAMAYYCVWRPQRLRQRMHAVRLGKGAKSKDGEMFGVAANWYSEVAPIIWVNAFFAVLAGLCTGAGLFLV
tara:strand:+ start:1099 stop:1425 length:327 start_codon:yes stop_codon:yes gene_type:complete